MSETIPSAILDAPTIRNSPLQKIRLVPITTSPETQKPDIQKAEQATKNIIVSLSPEKLNQLRQELAEEMKSTLLLPGVDSNDINTIKAQIDTTMTHPSKRPTLPSIKGLHYLENDLDTLPSHTPLPKTPDLSKKPTLSRVEAIAGYTKIQDDKHETIPEISITDQSTISK